MSAVAVYRQKRWNWKLPDDVEAMRRNLTTWNSASVVRDARLHCRWRCCLCYNEAHAKVAGAKEVGLRLRWKTTTIESESDLAAKNSHVN